MSNTTQLAQIMNLRRKKSSEFETGVDSRQDIMNPSGFNEFADLNTQESQIAGPPSRENSSQLDEKQRMMKQAAHEKVVREGAQTPVLDRLQMETDARIRQLQKQFEETNDKTKVPQSLKIASLKPVIAKQGSQNLGNLSIMEKLGQSYRQVTQRIGEMGNPHLIATSKKSKRMKHRTGSVDGMKKAHESKFNKLQHTG